MLREAKEKMGESNIDLNLSFVPVNVSDFLRDISMIGDVSEKITKLNDYVRGLEDEMKKIDRLKRELPICMVLLNDALGRLKEEIKEMEGGLEGLLPLKDDDNPKKDLGAKESADGSEKTWINSAQLWNFDMKNKSTCDQLSSKFRSSGGGAFMPCNSQSGLIMKEKSSYLPINELMSLSIPRVERSSINLTGIGSTSSGVPFMADQRRKPRRCWSPDLHRRFVHVLEDLGGPHVATPKQIKEKMQVDDLTNDEVKSHLQKYRLHVRKLPSSSGAGPPNDRFAPPGRYGNMSTKPTLSLSQSGSPDCPLHTAGSSEGVSISVDQGEDEKSEGRNWKFPSQKPAGGEA